MKYCINCGKEMDEGSIYCAHCGSSQDGIKPTTEKKRRKISKKIKKRIYIFVVLLVLVGVADCIITNRKDYGMQLYYVKDNKFYIAEGKRGKSYEISDAIANDSDVMDYVNNEAIENGIITIFNKDKKIIYADTFKDNHEYRLHIRSLNHPRKEPELIATGIAGAYKVSKSGNKVFYKKKDALFMCDFKKEVKIADDVKTFRVNAGGTEIIYRDKKDALYWVFLQTGKSLKLTNTLCTEKLFNGKTNYYVLNDFSKVYFVTKEKKLCEVLADGTRKELAEKVAECNPNEIYVYSSGELYFASESVWNVEVMDYVNMDIDLSEELEEPEQPEEPEEIGELSEELSEIPIEDPRHEELKQRYEELESAWMEEYYFPWEDEYNRWEEWRKQRKLYDVVKEATLPMDEVVYQYYDGKEVKEIGRKLSDAGNWLSHSDERAACLIDVTGNYRLLDIPHLYLTECEGIGDINTTLKEIIVQASAESQKTVIVYGGEGKEFSCDVDLADSRVEMNSDLWGEGIMYLTNGELRKQYVDLDISQSVNVIDTEVYDFVYDANGQFYYLKNYDKSSGTATLYEGPDISYETMEKENCHKLAENVISMEIRSDGELYYEIQSKHNEAYKDLHLHVGVNDILIATDVYDSVTLPNGATYYLADYDLKRMKGNLYKYTRVNTKAIDTEVTKLIEYYGIKKVE